MSNGNIEHHISTRTSLTPKQKLGGLLAHFESCGMKLTIPGKFRDQSGYIA
jgi:hypothetical protein